MIMAETTRDYILRGVFDAQDAGKTDEEIRDALEEVLGFFTDDESQHGSGGVTHD